MALICMVMHLYQKYPWLRVTAVLEDYIAPDYYIRLLKEYIFESKKDFELFEEYIKKIDKRGTWLELGCGTGRITDLALKSGKANTLDIIDLSHQMIDSCKNRFSNDSCIRYFQSDTVEYLEKTNTVYDFIFSLWSFSHSVHQIIEREGHEKGSLRIESAIKKMVIENMDVGSEFFLIHFDSLSDEQKILFEQWKKTEPLYEYYISNNLQSPSKLLIDKVFSELEEAGRIKTTRRHYVGSPISYRTLDEALEIFMNFHMESCFNNTPLIEGIVDELTSYFKQFTHRDGTISIRPGCFVYSFRRIK